MFANASPWYSKSSGEPTSHLNKLVLVREEDCLEVAVYSKSLEGLDGSHGFIPRERGGFYYHLAEGVVRTQEKDNRIIVQIGEKLFYCNQIIFEHTSACCYWQKPKREVRKPAPLPLKKRGWRRLLGI